MTDLIAGCVVAGVCCIFVLTALMVDIMLNASSKPAIIKAASLRLIVNVCDAIAVGVGGFRNSLPRQHNSKEHEIQVNTALPSQQFSLFIYC